MTRPIIHRTLVFEIRSRSDYNLAVEMNPSLSEIDYEALQGHFFALSGDLQFCTIPPNALILQRLHLMVRNNKSPTLMHIVK